MGKEGRAPHVHPITINDVKLQETCPPMEVIMGEDASHSMLSDAQDVHSSMSEPGSVVRRLVEQ